ncbi:GNAT family N-acetyltransferase [Parashewanella curva]|uniref:GNAT family N-acetyltransferase n=1 Tax=Parashewanella curva TaxID=2338552 RepID=A0A3L8Q0J8_9GAMM|nr:GNAT family N-acetyltransferase [Parashewanella curva]RLV60303.1 GNAT family N-acetyltransferase [Parashewanella curva]
MKEELVFREANQDEISLLFNGIIKEGWNPGIHDIHTYPDCTNTHFAVALHQDQPVSFASYIIYQQKYAFAGCYLVLNPEQRGQGFGLALTNHLLDEMKQKGVKVIGIDGVVAQRDNYAKKGFVDAYLHRQFYYQVQGHESIDENVSLTCPEIDTLTAFEAPFVPEPRSAFWQTWAVNDPSKKFACIHDSYGELSGFACLRKAVNGYRVGPIYAEGVDEAIELLHGLAAQVPVESILYIDIPEGNPAGSHFIHQAELTENQFDCMRMYKGKQPQLNVKGIFGVCTLEMG